MSKRTALVIALALAVGLAVAPGAAADPLGGSGDGVCTPDGTVCLELPPLDGTCDSPGCIPGGPGFE